MTLFRGEKRERERQRQRERERDRKKYACLRNPAEAS